MKNILRLAIILSTLSAHAATYEAASGTFTDYQDAPAYKAILSQLKLHGEFKGKDAPVAPKLEPKKNEVSRGKQLVEEAKARNRAILAQKRADSKAQDEASENLPTLDQWKKEVSDTHQAWLKEIADQRAIWKHEQDVFLGRVKEYQQNTFTIPAPKEKIIEKPVPVEAIPDVHIVKSAFSVPVRDQENRPTCAAFAGVRAAEILLAQNGVVKDLSEQYFYWASKPKCQSGPCEEKGSWVTPGYKFSEAQSSEDIPLEGSCGYKAQSVAHNETQVPLETGCQSGVAKILDFLGVKTLVDIIESMKKNIPVIMSARLTTNFYFNEGLVTFADSRKSAGQKMDMHSLGHAFLVVGVMELPEKLKATEGNYCLVVSNSWGKGWGAGGHSCLTEKWLTANRSDNTFIGLRKVALK